MQDSTDFSTGNNSGRSKSLRQAGSEENSDAITVVCRFRPITAKSSNKTAAVTADSYSFSDDNSVQFVSDINDRKLFTYDKVFGTDSTQSQVFGELCGVIESVMSGFNGTIIAYGQTSAGKSWTMEGPSLWDLEYQGVIPRCVNALFDAIDEADPDIKFQVTISYYEIYCEKVRDLLNPSQFNLKIRETRADGFVVQDVTQVFCTDREGVLRAIERGKANRASVPTLMNAESSRSHSIVTLVVEQKDMTSGRKMRGMLSLVDLAGSEKVLKTGASGMRLEEAKNINRSVSTLGMVINALCDGAPHIPYRDSNLTLILKDALGGNSKTTLVICCNPDSRHIPETLSTLRFGERAKRIKNNARVNEEYSVDELKALLAAARKEIENLKRKLAAALTGKVMLDLDDGAAVGEGGGGGTGVRGQRSRSLRHTRSFPSTSMGMVAAAAGGGAAEGIEVRLESVESMSMKLDDRSPELKGGGGALDRGKGEDGLGGRESEGNMSRSVDFSLEGLSVQRINSDGNIDDSEDEPQLQLQEEQQRGNAAGGGGVGRALIRRQSAAAATFGGSSSGSGKMRGMQAEGSGATAADGVVERMGDHSGNSSGALMVTVPVQEIAELKARLASMEEELEEERISWRIRYESCISIAAASEALRSPISELEDKLIKKNVDAAGKGPALVQISSVPAPSLPTISSPPTPPDAPVSSTSSVPSLESPPVSALTDEKSKELYDAAGYGNSETVRRLLAEKVADVNWRNPDYDGESALHYASRFGQLAVVQLLVEAEADINKQDKGGDTPLLQASRYGHSAVVQLLLECGADPSKEMIAKESHSHSSAARKKDDDDPKLQLKRAYSLRIGRGVPQDVLHSIECFKAAFATCSTNSIADLVILHEQIEAETTSIPVATSSTTSALSDTSLYTTSKYQDNQGKKSTDRSADVAEGIVMVSNPPPPDPSHPEHLNTCEQTKSEEVSRELYIAAKEGNKQLVRFILCSGYADINWHNPLEIKWTALIVASYKGYWSIVQLLLRAGANRDVHGSDRRTALMWAAIQGHVVTVNCLIRARADVDILALDNSTALICASRRGHINVVCLLVGAGAGLSFVDIYGHTAQTAAEAHGHPDVAFILSSIVLNY